MSDQPVLPPIDPENPPEGHLPSMLLRMLSTSGARAILSAKPAELGLAENLPFPFLALVGQTEMRIALLLAVINPNIGGVLLIGPRGTGKTTAVRALTTLLPDVEVSACENGEGCLPEDYAREGEAGVCASCLRKLRAGESITRWGSVNMIELPLNARLDDVVGGVNERIAVQQHKVKVERGILARADQNLLYVDEVNLLEDQIVDAILDASAAGSYTVRRGAISGTYRSRFVLIGSMNPEEGNLRPQLMDRFGLRVVVRGLMQKEDRLEIYNRVRAYRGNSRAFIREWANPTVIAREDVTAARELVKEVELTDEALDIGLELVRRLDIDSHRAEYVMFEAARAYAAADGRDRAHVGDVRAVAALALRQRRSQFMVDFAEGQKVEDNQIGQTFDHILNRESEGEG
ncbi:magnesium chelatase subunit I [Anaerolineae bacterium]|nr:magnesium chelatase subunit I [Anaerolineae bacterium]